MKQLLITITVILVSACGRFENSNPETNASGNYIMSEPEKGVFLNLTLNSNGKEVPIEELAKLTVKKN